MSMLRDEGRGLILLGAGGHARVLLSLVLAAGYRVLGVCDPALARHEEKTWQGIPVLGEEEQALSRLDRESVGLINGIGQLVRSTRRRELYLEWTERGFCFPPLVHPNAWVDNSVVVANGAQVMAGAIIQPGCVIGENTIVNTGARIDHDTLVAEHVHIAPGAVLCGGVTVGTDAFVGAGAVVIQGVGIGAQCLVAAGATVTTGLGQGMSAYVPQALIKGR